VPAITYSDFGGGLDRRLPIGVQEANRLWTLQNAYVTAGKKIKKRPGLRRLGNLGGAGLEALNGVPTVFTSGGVVSVSGPAVAQPLSPYAGTPLGDVLFCESFQGYPYVVGYYPGVWPDTPVARHHYIDGAPSTLITDVNCPHGLSVTKAASRIFSIGGEVVRYCAAGDARDWTTSSDAGFLATTLQQGGREGCTAVGTFDDALVVMFADGAQIWDVATDPSANQFRRRMSAVGTEYESTLAAFYRDLVFASRYGVRSISVQENVDRLDETDVGVPVDSLVSAALLAYAAQFATNNQGPRIRGIWLQPLGQYWLIINQQAFVYSFSRSAKLACWSVYEFPVSIRGVCAVGGAVYLRDATSLYVLEEGQHADDVDGSTPIAVDVQMAYQDAKQPGVEKMFYGADFVFSGTAQVSYLYDPRDTSKETNAQSVQGDTRVATVVPVEVSAAAIAPRFQHSANEAFELNAVTLYFHPLSAMSS
jgi:hypothetical protein